MRTRLVTLAAAAVAALCLAAGCGSSNGAEQQSAVPDVPRGFFGVVPQAELFDADLEKMGEGKVGTLRLVVPWGLIDATAKPNDHNYGYIDPIVLGAAERGIRVLPTLYGTPEWVAEDLDGADCAPNCASVAPRSEQAIEAFADFTGTLVERYGPKGELWTATDIEPVPIRGWQIWNEQNSPTFYQPEVDPQAYADLVEASAEAIHSRDPGAEVILGGMFGTPFQGKPPALDASKFLRELYAIDGMQDAFDSVAAHPYAAHQGKVELQVELLHAEIERAGDDAGLWITEMGASSSTATTRSSGARRDRPPRSPIRSTTSSSSAGSSTSAGSPGTRGATPPTRINACGARGPASSPRTRWSRSRPGTPSSRSPAARSPGR